MECPYKPVCANRQEEPCNSTNYSFCKHLNEYLSSTESSLMQDSQINGTVHKIILPKHRLDSWEFLRR